MNKYSWILSNMKSLFLKGPGYCCYYLAINPVPLFVTPWTVAHQASLSFTITQSLLRFMSIELVMLSNHLILRPPFLLLPLIFPNIRAFSSESVLQIRCQRIYAFELWCWRRLVRVPWTERRWHQSILKEINPENSLEGLMLKLKL